MNCDRDTDGRSDFQTPLKTAEEAFGSSRALTAVQSVLFVEGSYDDIDDNNNNDNDDDNHVAKELNSALETMTINNRNTLCSHEDCCSVCLSPIKNGAAKLTKCNHTFHVFCLKEAKARVAACPLCRTALTPNSNSSMSSSARNSNQEPMNPIVATAIRIRQVMAQRAARQE